VQVSPMAARTRCQGSGEVPYPRRRLRDQGRQQHQTAAAGSADTRWPPGGRHRHHRATPTFAAPHDGDGNADEQQVLEKRTGRRSGRRQNGSKETPGILCRMRTVNSTSPPKAGSKAIAGKRRRDIAEEKLRQIGVYSAPSDQGDPRANIPQRGCDGGVLLTSARLATAAMPATQHGVFNPPQKTGPRAPPPTR
jgi:hypothetical protein